MIISKLTTKIVLTILLLDSITLSAFAFNSASSKSSTSVTQSISSNQKSVMSADREYKPVNNDYTFGLVGQVTRSTSLYDHKDGTNSESLSYAVVPSLKMPLGGLSSLIVYNQDLKDGESTDNGFADTPVTFAFKSKDWAWSAPYILTLTPTLTAVIPTAKKTIQKDQLYTALSTGLSFGIKPDGFTTSEHGEFSLAVVITAGRNFHAMEEDINGAVLNKYSSNQTLNIGYSISDLSFSIEYIHKSRWTYKGNIKEAFALSEEIGYSINDHFNIAVGHSNEGAGLKANGYESNFNFINENDSTVYLTLGTAL